MNGAIISIMTVVSVCGGVYILGLLYERLLMRRGSSINGDGERVRKIAKSLSGYFRTSHDPGSRLASDPITEGMRIIELLDETVSDPVLLSIARKAINERRFPDEPPQGSEAFDQIAQRIGVICYTLRRRERCA